MISRQRQAAASGWLAALEKVLSQLKASLSKNIGLAAMKALLEDGAALIKWAKDERKELRHLLGKAPSVASTSKRGKK